MPIEAHNQTETIQSNPSAAYRFSRSGILRKISFFDDANKSNDADPARRECDDDVVSLHW